MNIPCNTRRVFMLQVAATAGGVLAAGAAQAQAKADENSAQAVALGYKHDTTKVDNKKFPTHNAANNCANCALFQAKASDAWGPCPLFPGVQVAAKGWCSAWAKKG